MNGLSSASLLNRRQLLAGIAAPLFGAAADLRLVSNVYIWTQEFRRLGREPAGEWEGAFAAIQRAGYKWVELASDWFPLAERKRTEAQLRQYGLGLGDLYVGGNYYDSAEAEKTIAKALDAAAWASGLGCRLLLVDLSPRAGRARKSDEDLAAQSRNLNRLGRELQSRGMALALHNHDDPMKDDAREWKYVVNNTDPKFMSVCLDLDWTWQAGTDPMPLLYMAGKRLLAIHLRTQRKRLWTEALEDGGDIDYNAVARYLRKIGFSGNLVVELAHKPETVVTRSVEENIRLSRLWAERVFSLK